MGLDLRMFDVTDEQVIDGVACSWCGARVGERCSDLIWGVERNVRTHAQRWRDLWNATHDRADAHPVFHDPKRPL